MAHGHEHYMSLALTRARAAGEKGNRPVASLIVRDGKVIGAGENTAFTDFDPSAHAEIAAIREACSGLRTTDLAGAVLYTTIEPCPMCFWCMLESRIATVVLGGRFPGIGRVADKGRYTVESFLEFTGRSMQVVTGVMQRDCEQAWNDWARREGAR